MFSRATLWRRKKRLKEILSQRLANTVSTFDENFLGSTSPDFFHDTNLETSSDEANSFNHIESQSHFSMSSYHYNMPKIDDELDDGSDFYDEKMWLEENVTDTDLWKNVEFEPAYPVLENEFLFNEISQKPAEKDIAAALVLLKLRHRISNKGINDLCKLLKIMKTPNTPANFSRVKRLFLPNSSPTPSSLITYICSICCEISTSSHNCNNVNCNQHSCFHTAPLNYLRLPILPQLREILAHAKELNFQQQREFSPDIEMMNDIYDGEKYQNIIKNEKGQKFLTLIMNTDGIQLAKNSNSSLWIFTFVINEIKRSERFKLKNIIVGAIVSSASKSSRHQMRTILSPIVEELLVLEQGEAFEVKSITVVIKPKSKKKIRVFPLVSAHQQQPRLRTNETYDIFMNTYEKERFTNNNELRDRLRGHIGPCALRSLTYFDVGTSFLSDSLHNIYHGVMKRLLHLWFDKKHQKQAWSIRSKLKIVDHYLSSIKYPSTSTRIPRCIAKYEKYKANEARSILLFGFSAFCIVLPLKYARHFLMLVVGVHIAESRTIRRTQIEDIRLILNRFLQQFPILYSPRNNSQSVHSIHHVAASVLEYGSLSNYSTFNFENILGLITSTVHSTRRHACEIHNNLKLLRLALIEFDRPSFNNNLKHFINSCQSTKRPVVSFLMNENQMVHFRQEDVNKATLSELQHLLRQQDIKLFKICYIFTNRFTIIRYRSSGQKDDSCLLFLLGGQPCIGFIQNIIQVRRVELLLRICKVSVKDQLCLNFNNTKLSCPNIFYGDIDMHNSNVFIKAEAIIEKIIYVYNKQLKCYVFSRIPNLCESS
ncbi:unnamed protein product [Rotaria socialis]|uniref:Uncharacterized protein n=1 Tax=Rotaria socialis TaxID=392032 RepID=A0A818PDT6_9BILA|nr:unnamed protein product [Rotaria socialis]